MPKFLQYLRKEGIEELSVAPVLPVTKWVPTTDNGGAQADNGVDLDVIGKLLGVETLAGQDSPKRK